MNIVLRTNGGERALVPFFRRPFSLLDEVDSLAREMWETWRPFEMEMSRVPQMDMYEDKDELVMKTELPGIDSKDLDITLEGDRLTIRAEKKEEVKEDATLHTRERYYGQYYRSMTLPYPVKEKEISATFENGVLELKLPKAEEVKPKRIEIKTQARLPEAEPEKKKVTRGTRKKKTQ